MALPTSQELNSIEVLRSRIRDIRLDEDQLHNQHLVRWIRGRDGDVSKAEEMIRKHVEWRKANRIDQSLLDWVPSSFVKEHYTPKFCGYDSEGSPILQVSFGKYDIRPALNNGEKENFIRYKDQCVEKVQRLMQIYERQRKYFENILSSSPDKITQFTCICDVEGFSMGYIMNREAVQVMMDAAKSFEANYPETMKRAYVVNCPAVFDILFRMVKPFLSQRTLAKIMIFDSDGKKWKPEILRGLPKEFVPVKYGGTRETVWDINDINMDLDQDATFFREIFKGHISLENGDAHGDGFAVINDGQGLKKLQIPPRDKLSIPFNINSPRVTLQWTIKTNDLSESIDFSIERVKPTFSSREIITEKKNVTSDEGTVKCTSAGNYWIIFDNSRSYSEQNCTTVYYRLSTEKPASKCCGCCRSAN